MKASGLLGSRVATTVLLSEPTRPCAHVTVTADAVTPFPVTWSVPPPDAAACGGAAALGPGPSITKAAAAPAATSADRNRRFIGRLRCRGERGDSPPLARSSEVRHRVRPAA